jgi:hypothetical protein
MYLYTFICNRGLFTSGFLTKREGRDHLKGIYIDRRIILIWILNK